MRAYKQTGSSNTNLSFWEKIARLFTHGRCTSCKHLFPLRELTLFLYPWSVGKERYNYCALCLQEADEAVRAFFHEKKKEEFEKKVASAVRDLEVQRMARMRYREKYGEEPP